MTIEEHMYLKGDKPPLPNEVIDLKEVSKLHFINTSFREYLCVYGDYIIAVYPFAIKVEWSFRADGKPVTYDYFKMQGVRSRHHHQDFTKGLISTDPCDIFEEICGIKIHHRGDDNGSISDDHLMYIDHSGDIRSFESMIVSQKRDNKLKEILK